MKNNKIFLNIFIVLLLTISINTINIINYCEAELEVNPTLEKLYNTGKQSVYDAENINEYALTKNIAKIIQIVLSFLGIMFLILIIISGYQWMTAGGNEEVISKAKKRIINATIGVVIVILSYSISYFIMWVIYNSSAV